MKITSIESRVIGYDISEAWGGQEPPEGISSNWYQYSFDTFHTDEGVVGYTMQNANLRDGAAMTQVVEEPHDVELSHPTITTTNRFPHPQHCLLCTLVRSIPERRRREQGLTDRPDHLHRRLLHHPVSNRGNPQRACPPIRLGNVHPPHWRRDITFRRQQPSPQRRELMPAV